MAYYRYDRIFNDMVEDSRLILLSNGEAIRKEALQDIKSMFRPNGKVEMAYQSDKVFIRS